MSSWKKHTAESDAKWKRESLKKEPKKRKTEKEREIERMRDS